MKAILTAVVLLAAPALGVAQQAPSLPNPEVTAMLGPLSSNLVMAISMDTPANGSIVFARSAAMSAGRFMPDAPNQFVKDGTRQCATFVNAGGFLSLDVVRLGANFTLATWAKMPFAGDDAAVWEGSSQSIPLYVQGGKFMCSQKKEDFAFAPYDKSLTGWHHLAVTGDGNTTSLYIDGVISGTAPVPIDATIRMIGRHSFIQAGANGQCDLLDDMFMFDRPLTTTELKTLAAIRLPLQAMPANLPRPAGLGQSAPPPGSPAPFTSVPSAPIVPPSEATDLLRTYNSSLVFVTGEGAGSGFIANMGGKPFLLTNAHVAAGVRSASFKTLQGNAVKPGAASVAVGHDIFGMQATATGTPFEVMRDVENNTAIGDQVVVLGNAEGGGVINTIMGRIVGVGPQLVEVDAPFQPGNSGSPIIHLKSKKVIAVATYLTIRKYDTATKQPIQEPVIRRFGYRIDSVRTWQPVDWNTFFAQATEMDKIEQLTEDFIAFIKDLAKDGRVSAGAHQNPVIRTRVEAWLSSKRNRYANPKDMIAADQNFIAFLKNASQSDVTTARARFTYDYFVRQLDEQQKERTEISGIFAKIIESLSRER